MTPDFVLWCNSPAPRVALCPPVRVLLRRASRLLACVARRRLCGVCAASARVRAMQRLLRASRGARGLATAAATPLKATLFPGDGVGPEISAAVSKILTVAGVPIDWDVQVVKHDKPDPRTNSFITRENLDSVKVRGRAEGG
jgi:isocitrate dehydrogenase (NAD+)